MEEADIIFSFIKSLPSEEILDFTKKLENILTKKLDFDSIIKLYKNYKHINMLLEKKSKDFEIKKEEINSKINTKNYMDVEEDKENDTTDEEKKNLKNNRTENFEK